MSDEKKFGAELTYGNGDKIVLDEIAFKIDQPVSDGDYFTPNNIIMTGSFQVNDSVCTFPIFQPNVQRITFPQRGIDVSINTETGDINIVAPVSGSRITITKATE